MSEQSQRRTSPDRCEETQHEEDDFEAEFLADLEGGSEVHTPVFVSPLAVTQRCLDNSCHMQQASDLDQPDCKRQKHEAPSTPDVNETSWSRQNGLLGQLPPEVVLRMFGFLSAEDLATSAQACRYMASISCQDELWKRLYCVRWAHSKHK